MSIDIEKISKLTGFVDKLIQIKEIEHSLNEEIVEELIDQAISISGATYSQEEKEAAKRDITWKYQIFAEPGQSILEDYDQENWYDDRKAEIEPKFWTRYKNYLIDTKHFSPNVVSTLGEDTLDQKLMNYILDPKAEYPHPVLRRGLIIGDVQSGKTSTYIGFICKAADAGYKVFILLTGTIESLRKQTQERVEEGFIGIDMSANTTGGKRVGVGLDNKPIHAMAMTSRASDFKGDNDKIAVSLAGNNDAVVFVIKKNTTTLTKLTNWLVTLNADPVTKKIDMPMLMIDDEADNASINTSASKEDPTKINKLIRELANVFTKSNYVGFTATPFANVFIDPETTEKMETQDLFPENFIVALPTPSNYIGPNRIFAEDGEYHSQLVYITDAGREEEDGYPFYFKHKKEWEDQLPDSLTDAIYTFYLANAIRDLRGDFKEHRSMLVNISRFVKVQKYIKSHIEALYPDAKFIGEEGSSDELSDEGYAFIVDPIDGTTNFVKDYHHSAISVALLKGREVVAGVVYNPYLDEVFHAIKGQGAFLNGKKISVSSSPIGKALVLFGSSPYDKQLFPETIKVVSEYFYNALDIRRSGSAALDLCYVACGRADVFVELQVSPWDFAAGKLLIEEAGGVVTTLDGAPLSFEGKTSILAKNNII